MMTSTAALEITASRQFTNWMQEQKLSLGFTTYQAGKLFLLGIQPDGRLSVFERTFNRCLGLWANGQTMWMTSLYQLWRFENVLSSGQLSSGHDRMYVPQVGYTTGDLDIHEIAVEVIALLACASVPSLRAASQRAQAERVATEVQMLCDA